MFTSTKFRILSYITAFILAVSMLSTVSQASALTETKTSVCVNMRDVKVAVFDDGNIWRFYWTANHQIAGRVNLTKHLATGLIFDPAIDNCRIAFVYQNPVSGRRDIYVVGVDGKNLHKITFNSLKEGHLDWLPDGRLIYEDLDSQMLHVIQPDGTGDEVFIPGSFPVVLPDGSVLFTYNNTIHWIDSGFNQTDIKDTGISGRVTGWTFQGYVFIDERTKQHAFDFISHNTTDVAGYDFVGQPNMETLAGITDFQSELSWFDGKAHYFEFATEPDWWRSDAQFNTAAAQVYFSSLK
jgi:hypothetical protein